MKKNKTEIIKTNEDLRGLRKKHKTEYVNGSLLFLQNFQCAKRHCKEIKNTNKKLIIVPEWMLNKFEIKKLKQKSPKNSNILLAIHLNHLHVNLQQTIENEKKIPDFWPFELFNGNTSGCQFKNGLMEILQGVYKKSYQEPLRRLTQIQTPRNISLGQINLTILGESIEAENAENIATESHNIPCFDLPSVSNFLDPYNPEIISPSSPLQANFESILQDLYQTSDTLLAPSTEATTTEQQLPTETDQAVNQCIASTSNTAHWGQPSSCRSRAESSVSSNEQASSVFNSQKFKKLLEKEINLQTYFELDSPCSSLYDYFGLGDLLLHPPTNFTETCFVNEIKNLYHAYSQNCTFLKDNLHINYKFSKKAFYIATFGELRLQNSEKKHVIQRKEYDISGLLELEILNKDSNKTAFVLPTIIAYYGNYYVYSLYLLEDISYTLKTLLNDVALDLYQKNYIFHSIAKALNYLHLNRIVHNNINIDSIFVSENRIRIGNFQCSVLEQYPLEKRNVHLVYPFTAPECLIGTWSISTKSDIWSFGILFAYVITLVKNSPFETYNYSNEDIIVNPDLLLNLKLKNHVIEQNIITIFTSNQFEILQNCLAQNPNNRPSCQNMLEKKWFDQKILLFNSDE